MRSTASRRVVCASLILCLLGLVPGPGPSGAGEDVETVVTIFGEHDHFGLGRVARTYFPGRGGANESCQVSSL